jgi:hypothetical protein
MQLLSWSAPQNPNQPRTTRHQAPQRRFHHLFPTEPLVRPSLSHFCGQGGVEHQHPLVGPILEVGRTLQGETAIARTLLEHVSKRRRPRQQRVGHAEGQPMCLAHAVVGVLSQQDHVDSVRRGAFERMPNRRQGRTQLSPDLQIFERTKQFFRRLWAAVLAPQRKQFAPRLRGIGPGLWGARHVCMRRVVENLCRVRAPQIFNAPI